MRDQQPESMIVESDKCSMIPSKMLNSEFKVINAQVIQADAQMEFHVIINNHTQSVHEGISYEHQITPSQLVRGDDEARNVGC